MREVDGQVRQVVQVHIPRTAGSSMKVWALCQGFSYQSFHYQDKPTVFDPSVMWTYMGHASLDSLKERGVTREWFDSCFSFAFVRNTWDRLVSLYEWHYHTRWYRREEIDFGKYVELVVSRPDHIPSQTSRIPDGVSFIGRYESLNEDWERLCKSAGLVHFPLTMRRRKSTEHSDYRAYYTNQLCDTVARHYAEEIDRFGFVFDRG